MTLYTTLHLYNVTARSAADYAAWFDGEHHDDLARLRGFRSADRYEVTTEQLMRFIPQPWQYLSIYEFETAGPAIDLPALAPALAKARDAGLIDDSTETERVHTFEMYSDWVFSPNFRSDQPFSGVNIVFGNFVPGMEAEYHKWYDEIHGPEVSSTPGKVAMKRGRLADTQIEPRRYCAGGQLILGAQQTDNLLFTIKDTVVRGRGLSPSGIAHARRSWAASFARTAHYFRKISGHHFWPGGIAYNGDLSFYPTDFARASEPSLTRP
jgi:hypothetical protein